MAKAGARVKITLRCNECKQRNYNTTKNKKNTPDRLEMNKYCPFCRKHTAEGGAEKGRLAHPRRHHEEDRRGHPLRHRRGRYRLDLRWHCQRRGQRAPRPLRRLTAKGE